VVELIEIVHPILVRKGRVAPGATIAIDRDHELKDDRE
jgi:hypothetical protein